MATKQLKRLNKILNMPFCGFTWPIWKIWRYEKITTATGPPFLEFYESWYWVFSAKANISKGVSYIFGTGMFPMPEKQKMLISGSEYNPSFGLILSKISGALPLAAMPILSSLLILHIWLQVVWYPRPREKVQKIHYGAMHDSQDYSIPFEERQRTRNYEQDGEREGDSLTHETRPRYWHILAG